MATASQILCSHLLAVPLISWKTHPFPKYLRNNFSAIYVKMSVPPGDIMLNSTQDLEKHPEKQRPSVISDTGTLDAALGSLDIDSKDADEAFSYLRITQMRMRFDRRPLTSWPIPSG
jgi:hypothetical protein